MLAVSVVITKTEILKNKVLRNRSTLFVLRMEKVKKPESSPIATPSSGNGVKYHQSARRPIMVPRIAAFLLEFVAGFIKFSFLGETSFSSPLLG